MDEADLFNNNKISNKTINLTEDNIAAERKFKLEVLEWLTDGQPKLFRSPTEGNYVVRLMNTSLSPNDTVGRMLHQFSSTGYECGPHDYQGLKDQGVMPSNAVIADPRPQPTITTKNLNAKGLITGEFWNIVYTTTTPSLQTLIKIDDKDIVNNTTSGTIVIPSAKKIAWEAQNSTITYNYQPELSKPEDEKDEFLERVNNTEDVMFTLPNDKTSYDLSNFILIYSLTISPKVNWTTVNGKLGAENKNNLKVIIDGQPIDLSDGNLRYYSECTVENIENNSDISVTIYGRRIKN